MPQPSDAEPPLDAPIRVLIAEDSAVNQMVARIMLERAGCEVVAVSDGDAVVAVALGAAFDVILMDLSMPRRSGIEATRAIRAAERGRRTPIVALTGHVLPEHRACCLAAGMDDHLAKPFTREDLAGTVRRWARRPACPARALVAS